MSMHCEACGFAAHDDAKFCEKCGEPISSQPARVSAPLSEGDARSEQRLAAERMRTRASGGAVTLTSVTADLEAGVGPELYRYNPFRITGLSIDAGAREIRQQSERLRVLARLGTDDDSSPRVLGLEPPPGAETVREALQRLRDPEQRFVAEFFWFWAPRRGRETPDDALSALEQGDADRAAKIWMSQRDGDGSDFLAVHNLAVLSHARALDLECDRAGRRPRAEETARGDDLWLEAYRSWNLLVDESSCWTHLKRRAEDFGDPRVTTGTVHRLRDALPVGLLTINARLAVAAAENRRVKDTKRQVRIMTESGFAESDVTRAFGRALEPARERLKVLCETAKSETSADPVHANQSARRLVEQAQPILRVFAAVLDKADPIRIGVCDEVALRVLECDIPFSNRTNDWEESLALLQLALPIAASDGARERIKQNIAIDENNLAGNRCWFCKEKPSLEGAEVDVNIHGDVTRTPSFSGSQMQWQIQWRTATIGVPRCATCKVGVKRYPSPWWMLGTPLLWLIVWGVSSSAAAGKQQRAAAQFPLVQERLKAGWQMGAKPADAN